MGKYVKRAKESIVSHLMLYLIRMQRAHRHFLNTHKMKNPIEKGRGAREETNDESGHEI